MANVVNAVVDRDSSYMSSTSRLLGRVARPIHSNFLVAATVVYVNDEDRECFTEGVNSETCVLTSCICAERAALCAIRIVPGGCRRVTDVYITSTAEKSALVTPGLKCREFLCEFSGAAMRVREALVREWAGDFSQRLTQTPGGGGDDDIRLILFNENRKSITSLFKLYPHRPRFHGVPRMALQAVGRMGSLSCTPVDAEAVLRASTASMVAPPLTPAEAAAIARAYECAKSAANAPNASDDLYPVHYAAAFTMQPLAAAEVAGEVVVSRGAACLEYGCSSDAVEALMSALVAARGSGSPPRALVQVDQWGVLAPPSAAARAQLAELGLGAVLVALHDADGKLVLVTAGALAPSPPDIVLGRAGDESSSPRPLGASSPVPEVLTTSWAAEKCVANSRVPIFGI